MNTLLPEAELSCTRLHHPVGLAAHALSDRSTCSSWAYSNVANEAVHVEAITAAVPGPIGLAGLAAGAAWTRKLRKRIKAAA